MKDANEEEGARAIGGDVVGGGDFCCDVEPDEGTVWKARVTSDSDIREG